MTWSWWQVIALATCSLIWLYIAARVVTRAILRTVKEREDAQDV